MQHLQFVFGEKNSWMIKNKFFVTPGFFFLYWGRYRTCSSLWAEAERDKMSACVCKIEKEAQWLSIWKTLFMPLVYALPTANAHQMLFTLLQMHQSSNGSRGLELKQIVQRQNEEFMFHFQIFTPLFFFLNRTDSAGKETHTDGYPLHVRRGGGGGAAWPCDTSSPTLR